MKKIIIYLLSIFLFLHIASCKKNPFVSKEVIEHIRDSIAELKSIKNICFIYNNDVYFLDEINNSPQRITNTPTAVKTNICISHNLQKIAYINATGNPEIIDRSGAIVNTLTAYSAIKQMDWSNDDATLYMLIGDQFYYFGPTITHPSLGAVAIPVGPSTQILSATLSKDNDLVFIADYYDFFLGDIQKMVIKKNDGSGSELVVDNAFYPSYTMRYVKFSANAKDLILGYSSGGNQYSKAEIYSNLSMYPDMEIPFNSGCYCKYPVYRSDKNCLVSAYFTGSGPLVLSAYFINDITFKNKDSYNSATSDLIVDWK